MQTGPPKRIFPGGTENLPGSSQKKFSMKKALDLFKVFDNV